MIRGCVIISKKMSAAPTKDKRMSRNVYHDFFDVRMNFRRRANFFHNNGFCKAMSKR